MDTEAAREAAAGLYKMGTISRLTGFTPAALRAWERRHGLLEPVRTAGGHRFYTEDDLRLLRRVAVLTGQGRPIGEIAALGREALLGLGPTTAEEVREAEPTEARPREAAQRLVERLVGAAERLDGEALGAALDEAFAAFSPTFAIRLVLEPAIHEIGRGWVEGRLSVASEHLASVFFNRRLLRLLEVTPSTPGAPGVVCACLPDEQHQLGGLVVAYQLGRAGARVTWLGPSLPLEDLEGAARTTGARVICLSVTRPALFQVHRPDLLTLGRRLSGRARLVLGGRGVPTDDRELGDAGVLVWPEDRSLADLAEVLLAPGS